MDFIAELIERHGWHVLGEVAALLVALVVAGFWARALLRGRAHPVICSSCGRVSSRATSRCPRCGEPLVAEG